MADSENFHLAPDDADVPTEEQAAELRKKLLEAEKFQKGGRPANAAERQSWAEELEALRAISRARDEDSVDRRGSGRQAPGFVPEIRPEEKREKKRVAVKLDEEEKD